MAEQDDQSSMKMPIHTLTLAVCLIGAVSAHAAGTDTAYALYSEGHADEALLDYQHLAKSGNALAQYNYAMLLRRNPASSAPHAWLDWLRKAADGGIKQAAFALGVAYEHGDGGLTKSQTDATHWFEVAAKQGHVEAEVSLGTQYFLGRGAPKSYVDAAHWYERAAEHNDVAAQYLIASMYEHGDGVKQDLKKAQHWYLAAARQGDEAAKIKAKTVGVP